MFLTFTFPGRFLVILPFNVSQLVEERCSEDLEGWPVTGRTGGERVSGRPSGAEGDAMSLLRSEGTLVPDLFLVARPGAPSSYLFLVEGC